MYELDDIGGDLFDSNDEDEKVCQFSPQVKDPSPFQVAASESQPITRTEEVKIKLKST